MYDGKTHDIALKYVVEEDRTNIAVGKSVKVKWGRSSWIWKAVVVNTFAQSESEPSPPVAKKVCASQVGPYSYSLYVTAYFLNLV